MIFSACGYAFAFAIAAMANRPLSADSIAGRIDQLIESGKSNHSTTNVKRSSDSEFLRRTYLDITGTIPTAAATRAFLKDASPNKRTRLIDQLLSSRDYARRMMHVFDVVFMERRIDAKVPRAAWEEYLRNSFAVNKPYDQLVKEILSSDGSDPKTRATAKFFLDREFEPNLVTRDIGRIFLGRNLQCAQCHDHPIVEDYKQEQFYGIYSFLNRSFLFPDAMAANAVIAEKADGDVMFVSVFDEKKVQKKTNPFLPNGKLVNEPTLEKGKEYKVAPAKGVRPIPTYSRREQLARVISSKDNPLFARTAVNRIWAMLFGRGLVHPFDMDHSGNPPTNPKLLDMLANEFEAHQYDMKWLIREIVRSNTYQLSSENSAELKDQQPQLGSAAELKPLTPEQYAFAAVRATAPFDPSNVNSTRKLDNAAGPLVGTFRNVMAANPGQVDDASVFTLDQSLFLKHGSVVRNLAAQRTGNLTDRLLAIKDSKEATDELFLTVLSRFPSEEERHEIASVLAGTKDRPAAMAEIVWALLVSAEFRFNH